MLDEPKYWISLLVGFVIVALSGIPLVGNFVTLPFALPSWLTISGTILLWVIAAAGLYLIIDSFLSEDDTKMWISVLIGLVIMAIALIQILNQFGIISFKIPGSILTLTVLRVLFLIEGIALIIAGFGDK